MLRFMFISLFLSLLLSFLPLPADAARVKSTAACVRAGCSSQLCVDPSDAGVITTCEYRPEYACYNSARCERQRNGKCGWTQDRELRQCVKKAKKKARRSYFLDF